MIPFKAKRRYEDFICLSVKIVANFIFTVNPFRKILFYYITLIFTKKDLLKHF